MTSGSITIVSFRQTYTPRRPPRLQGTSRRGWACWTEAYDDLFGVTPGPPGRSQIGRFANTIRTMAQHYIAAALCPAPHDHSRRPASADHRTLSSVIAGAVDATAEMQRTMRVTALGLDYTQFGRFKQLTPAILYFMATAAGERPSPPGYAPTMFDFEPAAVRSSPGLSRRPPGVIQVPGHHVDAEGGRAGPYAFPLTLNLSGR